jgi:alditol oxidase
LRVIKVENLEKIFFEIHNSSLNFKKSIKNLSLMHKRTFLKLSTALLSAPLIPSLLNCSERKKISNWAGNVRFSTDNIVNPRSIENLQDNIKDYKKIRTLGTKHSFNNIADTNDCFIGTMFLNNMLSIDFKQLEIKTQAGIKYGELAPYLEKNGYALHNLASLPHISVGGACATATHGSGIKNGNLASAVNALEIVDAKGEIVELIKEHDGERFNAAVVSLGMLGPVVTITLAIEPTYEIKQDVYQNMPMDILEQHFVEIMSAGYSVSLFTDWQKKNINEVWIKSKVKVVLGKKTEIEFNAKPEYFGAKLATKNLHPIAALGAENCTEQMGVAGAWLDRLPHFKMGFTPSSGKELQSEFFIDIKDAYAAIMAIEKLSTKIGPLLMISEIRTVAADNLWLSTAYKRDSVAIHFTWKQDIDAVMALLPEIEAILEPFDYRPHWGKIFTMNPKKLQKRYEKMDAFKAFVKEFDPEGKFRNEFIDKNIYG